MSKETDKDIILSATAVLAKAPSTGNIQSKVYDSTHSLISLDTYIPPSVFARFVELAEDQELEVTIRVV